MEKALRRAFPGRDDFCSRAVITRSADLRSAGPRSYPTHSKAAGRARGYCYTSQNFSMAAILFLPCLEKVIALPTTGRRYGLCAVGRTWKSSPPAGI